MRERIFWVETKNDKILIKAKSRDEAFAKFFKDVEDGKIGLEELGNIVLLHDGKKEYPFRTIPLLWQMKLLKKTVAVANIVACTGVSEKEAEVILYKASFDDSHLIPIIQRLRGKRK